jgi:ankyrin repeat protein
MSDSEDPLALIRAIENQDPLDKKLALIQSGIDVNKQDKDGWTALMCAAEFERENAKVIMRALVNAGADVNKLQKKFKMTALMIAANFGGVYATEMIKILVDARADVNKQDEDGKTALMIAARWGSEHAAGMIRLLVASGATIPPVSDLSTKTPEIIAYIDGAQNWTPLHRAADARDADAIIKCLSNGQRHDTVVDSTHPHMRTALSIAESTSYPTAQPVYDDCLALLRPSLVKGSTPIVGSLFGGGGGGGGGAQK